MQITKTGNPDRPKAERVSGLKDQALFDRNAIQKETAPDYSATSSASACRKRSKANRSNTAAIKASTRSRHKFPMLPACVWCTSRNGLYVPFSISPPADTPPETEPRSKPAG